MLGHVRYVTEPGPPIDPVAFLLSVLGRPETWLWLGGGTAAVVVALALVLRFRPLDAEWGRFVAQAGSYRPFVPWMLRLSAGLVLIGAGLTGTAFAPDVRLAGFPTVFLTLAGFLLLLGLAVRPASLVALAVFAVALVSAPTLVGMVDIAGGLAAIAFLGPGIPSLDDLLRAAFPRAPGARAATEGQPPDRYADVVPLLVRLGLGGALLASAISDKLLVPDQALATVEKYHLTALVPVDPGLWVVGTALVEAALGTAILAGLFTRACAIVAFAVLTLTLFGLPDDPVVAHVGLFGLSSVLVVLGAGRWSLDRVLGIDGHASRGSP